MDRNGKQTEFLVCVSASPSSSKIIERTERMAAAFGAAWTALYVETPDTLKQDKSAKESLNSNIDLAKRLGGNFVVIEGLNIATSVTEYARQANISDIVIGKSRDKKTLKNFFRKSLEEQIISRSENIDVHIVPDTGDVVRPKMPESGNNFRWIYVLTMVLLLAAATGICFAFQALGFSETNFILIYALTVILTSLFTRGFVYSIISSVISVLLFDFLFVEPYYNFHTPDPGYIAVLITMFAVSLVTGTVTSGLIMRSEHAIKREKHLEDLHFLSRKILQLQSFDETVSFLEEYFRTRLKSDARVYRKPFDSPAAKEALNAASKGALRDDDTDSRSTDSPYYVPVAADDNVYAVIEIDAKDGARKPDEEERTFIKMATAQFALAMEKQLMLKGRKEALISMEKEKTRSNLLRSVSHDLRTPLTAIYGSASAIAAADMDPETVKMLAGNICDDAAWLIRMVENLLLVTKLNDKDVVLNKQPEAPEEIIAEAVYKVKSRTGYKDIAVIVPSQLILVPMDAMLIEQVIINLLDNAVKYAGEEGGIQLSLAKDGDNAVITVSDNGKGVDDAVMATVSGKADIAANVVDGKKGMGIGLSLCYTIVRAHGGSLTAINRPDGGAEFKIILPTGE